MQHPMQQTHCSPRRTGRRVLAWVVALALVLGLVPGFPSGGGTASAHWADTYLSQLVEWGFIRADQAQNPDQALTRADFMSIVNRAYGYHETGETPFTDVNPYDWFYDDVGIAYTARYINGTSPTTASPNDPLDRETAATILGRNMMLKESAGEILDFTDARQISNWSRGTIKASLEHYLVSGYDDGTFRPKSSVTWGEMAAMVSRVIGTPLQEAGDYSLGGVFGNVTITSPGVTLRDTVISGDLYITGGVGLGGIKLENVTVLGRIIASGTGQSEGGGASILLRNVTADELLLDNLQDNYVSVRADGVTEIGSTTVRTSAYIEDNTPDGMGLKQISLEGDVYPEGEEPEGYEPIQLDLAGRIEEVVNRTPNSQVRAAAGTVAKLTVDEAAEGSAVAIDRGAEVKDLNLDVGVEVTGEGDVKNLTVNAPGADVAMLPDQITIRPGITAVIAGEEMDSVAAKESSEDPLILSGYPEAQDIAPTSITAVFQTNKRGTIYWAVSPITDGSVGADDLIKPPAYGNIAVRNGSLTSPKGNEEVSAAITGLVPNGSYYLSAVLVDARGLRSPVKVISFTTPDNTVPAFATGYPHMSKVSKSDSVVVVMPTKSCNLYYALLPAEAVAPTVEELKANAVANALGYGIRSVEKNLEDTFRVNDVILEEQKDYVLYLWLTDANGANSSAIVSLAFTTDDETPPEFIVDPRVNNTQETSVSLTFRLNENGTVYWVAVPDGTAYPKPEPGSGDETAPLNSDYAKLQVASGMNTGNDGKAGTVAATANTDGTITVSGLQPEQSYDFYYLAKDNAGPDRNYSVTVKMITINTSDNNGPVFSQSFSRVSGTNFTEKPLADTDIYLDVNENVRYESESLSFIELYQAVKDARSDNNESDEKIAVERLARSVFETIKLHKYNRANPTVEESVISKYTLDREFDEGVDIDYTQVTVENRREGGIRITFPASGLHLKNAGEYYFQISKLTDTANGMDSNAITPSVVDFNLNQEASQAMGHFVPIFTVDFAWVGLAETPAFNPDDGPWERKADGSPVDAKDASGNDIPDEEKFAPVHLYSIMSPTATSTVDDTTRYDILLWTKSVVVYDLYYRVVTKENADIVEEKKDEAGNVTYEYPATYNYRDPNTTDGEAVPITDYLLPRVGKGEDKAGKPDANGWMYLGNGVANPGTDQWIGLSVNRDFNGCTYANAFPQLNTLSSNLHYQFVIAIREWNGIKNEANWNTTVNFELNVAAGQANNLDTMARSVTKDNWKYYSEDTDILKSIGRWYDTSTRETVSTQKLSCPFKDSSLPKFKQAPTFDVTSTTATMNLQLTTAGTVYYAVGKAQGQNNRPDISVARTLTEAEKKAIADEAARLGKPSLTQDEINALLGLTPISGGAGGADGTYYILYNDGPNGDGTAAPPNNYNTMPAWMVGAGGEGGADLPEGENLIADGSQLAMNIFLKNVAGSTAELPPGEQACSGGLGFEPVNFTNLEPDTVYFAYLVIKGSGSALSHVYIYQFRTNHLNNPLINMTGYPKGANLQVQKSDAKLKYYVFSRANALTNLRLLKTPFVEACGASGTKYGIPELDKDGNETGRLTLPKIYQDMVDREDTMHASTVGEFTVLDALLKKYIYQDVVGAEPDSSKLNLPTTKVNGTDDPGYFDNYSVFDIFASDTLKRQLDNIIRGGFEIDLVDKSRVPLCESNGFISLTQDAAPVSEELDKAEYPNTYVIIALAVQDGKENLSNVWQFESFAAAYPVPSWESGPPETNPSVWTANVGGKATDTCFEGWVRVVFDQPLYLDEGGTIPLTAANQDKVYELGGWTSAAGVTPVEQRIQPTVRVSEGQTIITFNTKDSGWAHRDYITIEAGSIYSGGGDQSTKPLVIEATKGTTEFIIKVTWIKNGDREQEGVNTRIFRFPYESETTATTVFFLKGNVTPSNASDDAQLTPDTGNQVLTIQPNVESVVINTTITPPYEVLGTGTIIAWESSNPSVATVEGIGNGTSATIKRGSVAGRAKITMRIFRTGAARPDEHVLTVEVNGLSFARVSGTGAAVNSGNPNIVDWNLTTASNNGQNPNPSINITVQSILPFGTPDPVVTVTPETGAPFGRLGTGVTFSADRREATITLQYGTGNASKPAYDVTIQVGSLVCVVTINCTGSVSGINIPPTNPNP